MLEGFYNSDLQTMNKVQDIDNFGNSLDKWTASVVDTISVLIRAADPPNYSILNEFHNLELKTDGTITEVEPLCRVGSNYIVVNHRNSIETWSTPVLFDADSINYNFTISAGNAYGNNLIQVSPGVYAIYIGDVNQDGLVDGSDMSDTETDNNNFVSGYVVTDVNGDGLVDGSDMSVVETNNNNFAGVIRP